MNLLKIISSKKYFFILFLFVFFNFRFNLFNAVDQEWYIEHQQLVSDGLVVDTLIAQHIEVNSFCPFMLSFNNWQKSSFKEILLEHRKQVHRSSCYTSQLGLAPVLLSPFWNMTVLLFENNPKKYLYGFRAIKTVVALINAFFISLFFWWILLEFSSKYTLFLIIPLFFFQDWITVLGKSVYWQMWSWFAPMVFGLYYLRHIFKTNKNLKSTQWFILIFATSTLIYIKCLMGHEYISTVIVASIVPLIYYLIKFQEKNIIRRALLFLFTGSAGFIFALGTHYFYLNKTGFNAFKILEEIILKRTHAQDLSMIPEVYHTSLQIPLFKVMGIYLLRGGIFEIGPLAVLFLTIIYSYKNNFFKENKKHFSLFITIVVSFMGTISWYVLAKGHSYIHQNPNFVLWYLPTNLLIYLFFVETFRHYMERNFEIKYSILKKDTKKKQHAILARG